MENAPQGLTPEEVARRTKALQEELDINPAAKKEHEERMLAAKEEFAQKKEDPITEISAALNKLKLAPEGEAGSQDRYYGKLVAKLEVKDLLRNGRGKEVFERFQNDAELLAQIVTGSDPARDALNLMLQNRDVKEIQIAGWVPGGFVPLENFTSGWSAIDKLVEYVETLPDEKKRELKERLKDAGSIEHRVFLDNLSLHWLARDPDGKVLAFLREYDPNPNEKLIVTSQNNRGYEGGTNPGGGTYTVVKTDSWLKAFRLGMKPGEEKKIYHDLVSNPPRGVPVYGGVNPEWEMIQKELGTQE